MGIRFRESRRTRILDQPMPTPAPLRTCLAGLAALAAALTLGAQAPAPRVLAPIANLRQPLLFTYGTWEGRVQAADDTLAIAGEGVTNAGGGGANATLDLAAHAEGSPAVRVTVLPGNEAGGVRVMLRDADGVTGTWEFPLDAVRPDGWILPKDGASLRTPNTIADEGTVPPDLARLRQWQIGGDWARNRPMAVEIHEVAVIAADADLLALREARRAREEAQRLEAERRKAEARASLQRTPASPTVVHVGAATPRHIEIVIQAGTIPPQGQIPYVPQEGDEVRAEGAEAIVWSNGRLEETKEHLVLVRNRRPVGFLTGDRRFLRPHERVEGDPLLEVLADDPASFLVRSPDDAAFAEPRVPVAVHRKSKPNNHTWPERQGATLLHRVYLELPGPLQAGASYEIALPGLNTREPVVRFRHGAPDAVTESIHVSQIGFRPGDPAKRAYLSLWMGTGGGVAFEATEFHIVDAASGRVAFTGEVRTAKGLGQPERLRESRDYAKTAVYHLDFGAFREPGLWRVQVPGLGVSLPFPIADDTWASAYRIAMHGFLHHRSGIALGPPLTEYRRPRPMHPGDGVRIAAMSATMLDGESSAVNAWYRAHLETLRAGFRTIEGAWGGYMDAGDWDRRSQHLMPTYLLLELADLGGERLAAIRLRVPEDEAANRIPDAIDEALWNLDFYGRLQDADGGVGGGVESTSHPRHGETSWQETLGLGVFAPDPGSSYRFAAVASYAARLLRSIDPARAATYEANAARAWAWAEGNRTRFGDAARFDNNRMLAAIQLHHTTGAARYHDVVVAAGWFNQPAGENDEAATFAYARLPDDRGDARLKANARAQLLAAADAALAFQAGNPFDLANRYPNLPLIGYVGYFSIPGMISQVLPRAHALTGDPRYLAGTILSAQYGAGANPDNIVLTTGVGLRPVLNPLHIDSRNSGQPAPAGITVYGPTDPAIFESAYDWMHTWFLSKQMTPGSRTWPPQESYVDVFGWPPMNEYTVHQTFGPVAYTWGYLAVAAP